MDVKDFDNKKKNTNKKQNKIKVLYAFNNLKSLFKIENLKKRRVSVLLFLNSPH